MLNLRIITRTICLFLSALVFVAAGCSRSENYSLTEVRKLIDNGHFDKASKALDSLLKRNPDDKQALLLRAREQERVDDLELALDDYNQLLEKYPDFLDAAESRGKLKIRLKDYDGALDDLQKVFQKGKKDERLLSSLGLAYFFKKDFDKARELFNQSEKIDQKYEGPYFGRAAIDIDEKNYPLAIQELDSLLRFHPDNAQALFRRGFAYLKDSDPKKALDDFNKALELDPDLKEIYWYRAETNRALNRPEDALKDYEKAEQSDPNDPILYLNQGTILMGMGRYSEALEDLTRSIVLDPENPLPFINRAVLQFDTGNLLASLSDLNKAIKLRGDDPQLLIRRAYIFKLMARGDRALDDLDTALASDPGNHQALLLRGGLYFNETQLERAIGDLGEAINQTPDDPSPYQLLAEALLLKGDRKAALEQAQLALQRDSSYIPAYITIGDIQMSDLNYDQAAEAYSRALSIDGNNFEARLKRAKLYIALKDFPEAVDDLDAATKINPYSGEVYALRSQCYGALGNQEKARQDTWRARVFVNR